MRLLKYKWYGVTTLTVCFLCVIGILKGQTVWSKTYVENRPLMYFSSVVQHDSIYHVVGGTRDTNGNPHTRIFVGEINKLGALINYKTIFDSVATNFGGFYNSALAYEDNILYTGYAVDTQNKLLVFNKNIHTDSIVVFQYITPGASAFQGYKIVKLSDYYFVTGVYTDQSANSPKSVLIKLDSNFNRIWEKYYGINNRIQYSKGLVVLSSGNLMMGSLRNNFNNTNERSNTWLIEVDTGGNVLRQWLDNSDSTYVAEGLLQTQDGGFVFGAQKKNEQSVNDVYKIATIVKMDSAFNKQWMFTGGYQGTVTGFTDIAELQDGSIVACGKYNYRFAWIVKLNSNGNVIWDRQYVGVTALGSESYLTDIDVLPDGGFVAVGQCLIPGAIPPQVGWVLTLDSNGCEVENCLLGIDNEEQRTTDDIQIHLQPNPASGSVQLTIEREMIGGEISVYNITGALVLQQTAETEITQLNIISLPKGLYVVSLGDGVKNARAKLVVD